MDRIVAAVLMIILILIGLGVIMKIRQGVGPDGPITVPDGTQCLVAGGTCVEVGTCDGDAQALECGEDRECCVGG